MHTISRAVDFDKPLIELLDQRVDLIAFLLGIVRIETLLEAQDHIGRRDRAAGLAGVPHPSPESYNVNFSARLLSSPSSSQKAFKTDWAQFNFEACMLA